MSNDIKTYGPECSPTYGSPCLESLLSSFILISLFLDKYHEVGEEKLQFESVMCTGYIIKMSMMALMLFQFFVLGISLLVSGSSSYDQILLGFLIGIYFSFLLHFKLKIHFKYLPVYLSRQNTANPLDDYDENFVKFHVKWYMYVFSMVAMVVIPGLVATLAWNSKSIYLIDGAFKRIMECSNNHLKAL